MARQERRVFPRIKSNLPIKYEIVAPNSSAKIIGISSISDISAGGIKLPSTFPIEEGSQVNFKLHLDTGSNIDLHAIVIWTDNSMRYKTIAGLEFDEIATRSRSVLSEYIEKMLLHMAPV